MCHIILSESSDVRQRIVNQKQQKEDDYSNFSATCKVIMPGDETRFVKTAGLFSFLLDIGFLVLHIVQFPLRWPKYICLSRPVETFEKTFSGYPET